jgi:hypothetical protein
MPAWALALTDMPSASVRLRSDAVAFSVDARGCRLEVFLTTRQGPPFARAAALPGARIDEGADADLSAPALRALAAERTVGTVRWVEPLGAYSASGRDPRQFGGRIIGGVFERTGRRTISHAALVLCERGPASPLPLRQQYWADVYTLLPWEDMRSAQGRRARSEVLLALLAMEARIIDPNERREWQAEVTYLFGNSSDGWNEELAGERLTFLRRACLLTESGRDLWGQDDEVACPEIFGFALAFDHRQMVADALGRLRGRIKYVPALIQAMMPEEFSLATLQGGMEAVAGRHIAQANFRRLVAYSKGHSMVVPTGSSVSSGGRPAEMFRWSEDVPRRLERAMRLPWLGPVAEDSSSRPESALLSGVAAVR